MNPRNRLLPSPALIVACIALIFALGGTAAALSGKDTVAHNDLKNNVVHSAEIKKGQVKSSDLSDGSVKQADLAEPEDFRRVGDAGEPAFSDGGDGDCQWLLSATEIPTNPVGFYKDPFDTVHLVGAASNEDDSGGDGLCVSTDPGEIEDSIVFQLPAAYRPENATIVGVANSQALVIGDEGIAIGGVVVPAGSVLAADGTQTILDGATFRAASEGTEPIDLESLQRLSLQSVRRLAAR